MNHVVFLWAKKLYSARKEKSLFYGMVKPFHVLLTLLAVGVLCAVAMFLFPKNGVKINDEITLNFPHFDDFLTQDSVVALDVDSLLNSYEIVIDSTEIKDSIKRHRFVQQQKLLNLQFPKKNETLPNFYQALEDLKHGKRSKVRIIHYGDSQIEGDRITSYVRQKLQEEFGGSGPGMLPLMQFIPNMSIVQEQSENWLRYTVFGRKDTTVKHNHFGLRGIISRFKPYTKDSVATVTQAWVKLKPSRVGYGRVKRYRKLRMHYGYNETDVAFTIKMGDQVVYSDTLPATNKSAFFEYTFDDTPEEITLEFAGKSSPDFYSVSLESATGIILDNVAMRGSSGTIFKKISQSQLAYQFGKEPISLVILQYGGNTVPYIDSEKEATNYGRYFAAQIAALKKLLPHADIVFIGPSDMSTKEKTAYVTYPFLPKVRDALKKAAHDEDIAFWDLYEVMGGKNSMPSWVAAKPPLAGPDYVHFTPSGARRVAELFYKALYHDYDLYKKAQQKLEVKQAVDTAKTTVDSLETTP